jgi:hypothetical protein
MIGAGILASIISLKRANTAAQVQTLTPQGELILPTGGLLFKTKEGKLAAKLEGDDEGGSLILYNGNSQAKILLIGTQDGGGLIGVTPGKAGAVLQLAGHEDGGSIVLFSAKRGKRVVRLSAHDDGGSISVNGPTGDEAVIIDTEDLGKAVNGRIDVLESMSGKILWTSPVGTPKRR